MSASNGGVRVTAAVFQALCLLTGFALLIYQVFCHSPADVEYSIYLAFWIAVILGYTGSRSIRKL